MDYTELGIRNGRPFTVSRGADDTDIAFRIGLKNPSHTTLTAATITINAATSAVVTITGGATTTFAFATYTTMGTLLDAMELHADVGPYCWIRRCAMLRAWLTADLAALSATSIRTNAGVSVLWDTSDLDRRAVCIGDEEDSTQAYGAARSSAATLPVENDGEEQLNQAFKASDSLCAVRSVVITATWNASAQTVEIYELTNKPGDSDPSALFSYGFTGTGSAQTVNLGPPGMASLSASIGDGIRATRAGRRLLIVTGDGTNNITSSTVTANGVIGQ